MKIYRGGTDSRLFADRRYHGTNVGVYPFRLIGKPIESGQGWTSPTFVIVCASRCQHRVTLIQG